MTDPLPHFGLTDEEVRDTMFKAFTGEVERLDTEAPEVTTLAQMTTSVMVAAMRVIADNNRRVSADVARYVAEHCQP